MPTASEQIAARRARYDRVERVVDALDRTFGVKQLRPSQQLRIQELAPNLQGTTATQMPNGTIVDIPKSAPLIMAASVVEVDGTPITFAKTRGELDAVLDMLDGEGLAAVAEALSRFGEGDENQGEGGPDTAKN